MAILMALAALQWLGLVPWFGPGPAIRTFNLWYALPNGLMAYIYIWLTQKLSRLDQSSWLFLAVITVFNLMLKKSRRLIVYKPVKVEVTYAS